MFRCAGRLADSRVTPQVALAAPFQGQSPRAGCVDCLQHLHFPQAGVQGVRAFEWDVDARSILEGLSVRAAQGL
jgi:hypothetical protein